VLLIIANLAFIAATKAILLLFPDLNPNTEKILEIVVEFIMLSILFFLLIPFVFKALKMYDNYRSYLDGIHLTSKSSFLIGIVCTIGCYIIFVGFQLVGSFMFGDYVFDLERIIPTNSYWLINVNAGIFEEIMFRGIILSLLLEFHSKWTSVIVSSVIFGMVHFANFLNGTDYVTVITILAQVIWAIGMGFLWGIITVETKSIIPGIFLHYLSNSLDSLWLYLPGASIEEQLLYKLLFAKIYPIILSIIFVLIVIKSRKREINKNIEAI
jgi:membrane protease YdiL (CAAX protease family)